MTTNPRRVIFQVIDRDTNQGLGLFTLTEDEAAELEDRAEALGMTAGELAAKILREFVDNPRLTDEE